MLESKWETECQYVTRKKNEADLKGADTKDRMNVLSVFESFISVHFYISDAFLSLYVFM